MVCFQNGLCEERIARIAGPSVVGAVVGWGATMPEPGVYERTAAGGFTLGRTDGRDDPRLAKLALILEAVGPVTLTSNLAGARWSKLAINCAISTLGTLGGERLGALMMSLTVRRLALRIMTEVVRVARAEGALAREGLGHDRPRLDRAHRGRGAQRGLALAVHQARDAARRGGPLPAHALVDAVGHRAAASLLLHSLNGEVVDRGARLGVATPVNAEAQRMVHAIARGELTSSMATLYAFAERVGVR